MSWEDEDFALAQIEVCVEYVSATLKMFFFFPGLKEKTTAEVATAADVFRTTVNAFDSAVREVSDVFVEAPSEHRRALAANIVKTAHVASEAATSVWSLVLNDSSRDAEAPHYPASMPSCFAPDQVVQLFWNARCGAVLAQRIAYWLRELVQADTDE